MSVRAAFTCLMRGRRRQYDFSDTHSFWLPVWGPQTNSSLGVIRYIYWNTDSSYHALNVNLAKTMKHGFQYQVAYSYAKSLDGRFTIHRWR